jgi:hypothetical protein
MDLAKLNRTEEDRSVVWAAVLTAFTGLGALVAAILARLAGDAVGAGAWLVVALLYAGLAYGVYRGSRAAAVMVVALFVLNAAAALLLTGPSLLWILPVIWGATLYDGMRGVFAQHARAVRPDPRARRPA